MERERQAMPSCPRRIAPTQHAGKQKDHRRRDDTGGLIADSGKRPSRALTFLNRTGSENGVKILHATCVSSASCDKNRIFSQRRLFPCVRAAIY